MCLPSLHFLAKFESLWFDCLSCIWRHLGKEVESSKQSAGALTGIWSWAASENRSRGIGFGQLQDLLPVSLPCSWEPFHTGEWKETHLGWGGGGWGSWLCRLAGLRCISRTHMEVEPRALPWAWIACEFCILTTFSCFPFPDSRFFSIPGILNPEQPCLSLNKLLKRTTHYSSKTQNSAFMTTQGAQAIKFQIGRMLFYLGKKLNALNTVPFAELIWQCGRLQTPLDLRASGLRCVGR